MGGKRRGKEGEQVSVCDSSVRGKYLNCLILTFKEKKMKNIKTIICLVLLLASFVLFINPVAGEAEQPRVLNIVENDWPPYYFAGKPNMPEGFAKEILKMCLSEMGYTCKFNFYPVKRMYSYMKKGKIDITLFSYKKERPTSRKSFSYSNIFFYPKCTFII